MIFSKTLFYRKPCIEDRDLQDKNRVTGEISVFFALIFTITAALIFSVVESARTEGSRLYLTVAANSSIDSLFSQYHKTLWKNYHLLGLEHYAYDQLTDEMKDFIEPYFEADTWYPMKYDHIDIDDIRLLTDEEGEVFEQEVIDYMRYGIAASVWNLTDMEKYMNGFTENTSVNAISDLYSDHAKEAARLEKCIKDISSCIDNIREKYENAVSLLSEYDGSGFIKAVNEMKAGYQNLKSYVKKYETMAESMKAGISSSRKELDQQKSDGSITQETWEILNDDICEYESYVLDDGERRREISNFPVIADSDISVLEAYIEEAEEIMEYIETHDFDEESDGDDDDDSLNPYDEGYESDDDDEDEEEISEEDLWEPLVSSFDSFSPVSMNSESGIRDEETERRIESLRTLFSENLLKLVLPEGTELKTDPIKPENAPSEDCFSGSDITRIGLIDRLYTSEYILSEMNYFGRGIYDNSGKTTGSGLCEVEYILFGGDNDAENLESTVKELIGMRTGSNLLYLYSDTAKKNEARALALTITGAVGLTPLTTVITFLILSVWAMGQAILDVRDLLSGERVPFMHNSESFYLSIEGLLELAAGNTVSKLREMKKENQKGFKYSDYLRILLFLNQGSVQDYRSMDIIQLNLMKAQKDFRMDRMAQSLDTRVYVKTAHLFSELNIVKNETAVPDKNYEMSVNTAYSY